MFCVNYKFFAKLAYSTLIFNGDHVTTADLKRQIMDRENLKSFRCDLLISNAQTNEEYADDGALIPKNSSVVIRRIPVFGGKKSRCSYRPTESSTSVGLPVGIQISKMVNLAEEEASEEDKIKTMMAHSSQYYSSLPYMRSMGHPPPHYTCFRCGMKGHYFKQCPTIGDKGSGPSRPMKRHAGIPFSKMMVVDDPNTKGALLTKEGAYVVPIIDAEAYATGKMPPLSEVLQPVSSVVNEPPPDELLCLICKHLLVDAVIIPCCGNSYCDDCIRTRLLELEDRTCPTCGKPSVSPDSLVLNKMLRQAVENYRNGTGYTQVIRMSRQARALGVEARWRDISGLSKSGKRGRQNHHRQQKCPSVTHGQSSGKRKRRRRRKGYQASSKRQKVKQAIEDSLISGCKAENGLRNHHKTSDEDKRKHVGGATSQQVLDPDGMAPHVPPPRI